MADELCDRESNVSCRCATCCAITRDEAWSSEARNVVAAIFRLEHHRNEQEVVDVLGLLVDWLKAPEQTQLRRHFTTWIKRVLLLSWVPKDESHVWQSLNELKEVHNMFAERAKRWPEQWRKIGQEEGLEKGLEKGRLETARNLVEQTGMDDQTIAKLTGLDSVRVATLRAAPKR